MHQWQKALRESHCTERRDDIDHNPDFLFLGLQQTFDLSSRMDGFFLVEYTHMGRAEMPNNDPLLRAPSYELLNLRLGLRLTATGISATLWGRNVLDEEYRMGGLDPVAADGRIVATPREPATWGITLRKDF